MTRSVNLSSLDFSRSEPAAGTVAVSFGGAELGSGSVNRTYDGDDEIGTATVVFQIPAGTAGGSRTFGITVPSTGTTSSFTIPVD